MNLYDIHKETQLKETQYVIEKSLRRGKEKRKTFKRIRIKFRRIIKQARESTKSREIKKT